MHFLYRYLVATGLFVVIDSIWIAGIANKFYKSHMGNLLLDRPKFTPAVVFYILYIFGIVVFVINPGLGLHKLSYVIAHAALLGLVMYATYDLTNLATLKKWPIKVTIVDLIWGTFITTTVSSLTYVIFR